MAYSEIVLVPGSARQTSLTLLSRDREPIDFLQGVWRVRLVIVPYPMYDGDPFYTLVNSGTPVDVGPGAEWLSLTADSKLVLTPDPDITLGWRWTRYHYDCWLTGPNENSKPDRAGHGPIKMDW